MGHGISKKHYIIIKINYYYYFYLFYKIHSGNDFKLLALLLSSLYKKTIFFFHLLNIVNIGILRIKVVNYLSIF
ncbi:hypothetical protein C1646_691750 [Rhizophagus diaphanus]|nr:hypothetical protein C1646_691750 [Rhizophagus diaphanus] [Rhizophagus sp. MUCL 43196]